MSIFTESEKNFLSSLGDTDIFIESSKSDRVKVLNKTIEVLESLGFNPKISKPSRVGWINENNSGDFEESLCISLGKLQGLESVCTKVNKEIKPLGGKVSPDNYGTIFLSMKDNVVTESYIGNYFRNKVLLHKLGKNPELNERTIIKFIKNLTLKYEESLLDEDVQKIMKKRDVADYYVPQAELNFPDGMVITFAFCYDKKSLTPGAAFKNDRNDYIVLLYPCFFDCRDMDVNVFTVMHEIGHIRLGHCELKNQSLDSQRRQKVMVKGGAIYTELNADLYASLNGAKMYTILKEGINKDYDKKYDYRYTNNELSKRYSYVLKHVRRLRPMTENTNNSTLYHLSETNLDGKTLSPRIPSNFLVDKGFEDKTTKRVCFSKSIDGSLRGMSMNLTGKKLYVHIPENDSLNTVTPSVDQVPDCKITNEVWVTNDVKLRCIGIIEVISDKGEDGIPYTYGDNTAELYDWNWKWIERYDESFNESTKSTIDKKYKPKGDMILSSLKKVHITESIIEKYKKEYPFLKHVRCKDTDEYICDGYIWFDENDLVAMVGSCEYTDDKTKWIVSLEIVEKYRGFGLSKQILEFAVNTMNCKYLSVNKNNKVAKKVYDDYGFKVYQESKDMYYMTLEKNPVIVESVDDHYLSEGVVMNDKDIYYNKDKFESGETNLCFITGHSGSGKSTMGRSMVDKNIEHYDLDDVVWNKERFTIQQLKEYGDLIYSFFNGPGKKYFFTADECKSGKVKEYKGNYEFDLINDFIDYSLGFAKSHKNTKFVIEGIWLYMFVKPSKLDECAVYVKGTSAVLSAIRAAKRDSNYDFPDKKDKIKRTKAFIGRFGVLFKGGVGSEDSGIAHERYVKEFRNYFKNKSINESVEDIHDNWCYITESEDKKRTAKTGEFEIEKVEFKVYNDRDYSYVTVKGIDKPLRGRSEVIIMKDDEVYLCFDNDRYRLPGGGWDKGESYEHAALRETKEEAKINCTNIKYCTSRVDVSDGVPDKCKKENIPEEGYWYGYFTKVFIAEYDKKFSGHVDKEDQDPSMVKTGKFYPFEEIKDQLYSEHKEAIEKYLGVNDEVFKEDALDDDAFDMIDVMLEAASDSHIIKDALYPPIEAVLKTRDGDKLFKRYVEEFIDRNTEKLHEPCPISLIPFTDNDKARFFSLFNLNEKECIKVIGQAAGAVSSSANFRLVKQNPIFCVFYLVLRYYIINKDESGINSTLAIHALASYPSVFSKYFKYGANPGIMRYTADHLTEKFIFKQEGHVFGALRKSIEASYKFLKPYFDEAADKEMIRYIQRIRNDQNSLIKKIANEYQKNYKAGKSVSTQNETYDTGALIDDYNNDTSKAETASHSIIISLLTNGIDLRILETASEIAQLSISELRLYLVKILVDSRSTEIEDFISAVLFIYLYDEKHTMDEIKSKQFLSFGISLFRKTNSNDKNISTIKKTLDKWAEETGIHNRYKREPTRIAYKKGIYWYILLTIQSNL